MGGQARPRGGSAGTLPPRHTTPGPPRALSQRGTHQPGGKYQKQHGLFQACGPGACLRHHPPQTRGGRAGGRAPSWRDGARGLCWGPGGGPGHGHPTASCLKGPTWDLDLLVSRQASQRSLHLHFCHVSPDTPSPSSRCWAPSPPAACGCFPKATETAREAGSTCRITCGVCVRVCVHSACACVHMCMCACACAHTQRL